MTLDSVRIACANVESDLAATLAEAMVLPAEAKKLLANVLRAPGHVVAGQASDHRASRSCCEPQ